MGRTRRAPARRGPPRVTPPSDLDVVDAFVGVHGDPRRLELLHPGLRLRSIAHDLATASIPRRLVQGLASDPRVTWLDVVTPGAGVEPCGRHDDARPAHAADFLAELGLSGAPAELDGRGTIVGVVDAGGLDAYHPAFLDDAGATRVDWIWDQAAAPGGAPDRRPSPWGYGAEYSRHDIQRELELPQGEPRHAILEHRAAKHSHGTHTAGVAAGAQPGRYRGVAPGARIVYVETLAGPDGAASATTIADALAYCFRRAGASPCAVNLSLGVGTGPHDGGSALEAFIDRLLTVPGRAVIVAAGNQNTARSGDGPARDGHAAGTVAHGGVACVDFRFARPRRETIELWYPADDRIDVEIVHPLGDRTPRLVAGAGRSVIDLAGWRLSIATCLAASASGRNLVRIAFDPPAATIARAVDAPDVEALPPWRLVLVGRSVLDGRFDAWVGGTTGAGLRFGAPWALAGRDRATLTSPGGSRRAITVGAYAFDGVRGPPHMDVMDVSGRGPTLDGRAKPDVVAYGGSVPGPASHDAAGYVARAGTSVAAPQATGLAALAFQRHGAALHAADLARALRGEPSLAAPALRWERVSPGAPRGARIVLAGTPGDAADLPSLAGAPWAAPAIRVAPLAGGGDAPDAAAAPRWTVAVRVQNVGDSPAPAARVSLEWAEGATWLPESAWRAAGVAPVDADAGVLEGLAAGASGEVRFAWSPGTAASDAAVSLRARVETDAPGPRDPGPVAVHRVWRARPVEGVARFRWLLRAPGDRAGLWLDLRGARSCRRVALRLPVWALHLGGVPLVARALPPTGPDELAGVAGPRARAAAGRAMERALRGVTVAVDDDAIRRSIGIRGADRVDVGATQVRIDLALGEPAVALLDPLFLAGAGGPIVVEVHVDDRRPPGATIDVGQLDDGLLVGGARLVVGDDDPDATAPPHPPAAHVWRAQADDGLPAIRPDTPRPDEEETR